MQPKFCKGTIEMLFLSLLLHQVMERVHKVDEFRRGYLSHDLDSAEPCCTRCVPLDFIKAEKVLIGQAAVMSRRSEIVCLEERMRSMIMQRQNRILTKDIPLC